MRELTQEEIEVVVGGGPIIIGVETPAIGPIIYG